MPGDFNINIDKLPESPIFWALVAIAAFLILLATGHGATAVVLLFTAVGIILLVTNINSSEQSQGLWAVCVFCFVMALVLGLFFVPDEWSTKVAETLQSQIPITPTL